MPRALILPFSQPQYDLRFPSNGDAPSSAFVALQRLNPHLDGLPIWGPGNQGMTWIWEYTPRQHTGYHVSWWWSNTGPNSLDTFNWDSGNSNTYVGCHPYSPDGSGGTTKEWEIGGMDSGNDSRNTLAGSPLTVVYGTRFLQACRVTHNGGTKTARFYIDLPSTANGNIIEHTSNNGWGDTNPPNPALTIGDSPWARSVERASGQFGRWKVIAKVLSEANMLLEAADMSRLVTADAIANVYWGKTNWRHIDDLVCDFGTGRSFSWATEDKGSLVQVA